MCRTEEDSNKSTEADRPEMESAPVLQLLVSNI